MGINKKEAGSNVRVILSLPPVSFDSDNRRLNEARKLHEERLANIFILRLL